MMVTNPMTSMNNPERPTSSLILILNVIALAGTIKIIVIIGDVFAALPNQIPIHYSINGNADRYGSKLLFWILPMIAAAVFTTLSLAQRNPKNLRFPVVVTTQNVYRQLYNIRLMFCFIKLYAVTIMLFLTVQTIKNAYRADPTLSPWFLPGSLAAMIVIISIFIHRSYRLK